MSLNVPDEPQIQFMNTMWDVPGINKEHSDGIIGLFGDGTGTKDYFFYHLFTPEVELRGSDSAYFNICYQIAESATSNYHCLETTIDSIFDGSSGKEQITLENKVYSYSDV